MSVQARHDPYIGNNKLCINYFYKGKVVIGKTKYLLNIVLGYLTVRFCPFPRYNNNDNIYF
jgi:hypothetical protein